MTQQSYLGVTASLVFTTAFVGPLYAIKRTRIGDESARDEHGRPYTRDHPTVIKARLATTSLSMPLCAVGVWALARHQGMFSHSASALFQVKSTLALIGLRLPNDLSSAVALVLAPAALTLTLYAGPLLSLWLDGHLPLQRHFSWSAVKAKFTCWQGIRNYIHAPICEEFVFRACIVAAGALTGATKLQLIFLTPTYFGLAHIHHAYETYLAGGRTKQALVHGLIQSTVQFSYTYLMGVYGAWLFLRTSSVIPPIVAHGICNVMGLPQIGYEIEKRPKWRIAILATYALGIWQFARGWTRWTRPDLFGASVYESLLRR